MRLSGRSPFLVVWFLGALLQVQPGSFVAQVPPSPSPEQGPVSFAPAPVNVRPENHVASIEHAVGKSTAGFVRVSADRIRPEGPPPSFDPGPSQPVFRLRIPAIGVNKVVVEGTEQAQLAMGPGHYPVCGAGFAPPYCDPYDEVWPGERGRMLVAAHRTLAGADFLRLGELRSGDHVRMKTSWGTFDYEIDRRVIVDAADMSIVVPRGRARELVLVTCHPKYSSAQRLLYFAHLKNAVATRGNWR